MVTSHKIVLSRDLLVNDPQAPQHMGQIGEHTRVQRKGAGLATAIGATRGKRQSSPLARVTDVDVSYSGQSPLIENGQPLPPQRVKRMGDNERTRNVAGSTRSMRGSSRRRRSRRT